MISLIVMNTLWRRGKMLVNNLSERDLFGWTGASAERIAEKGEKVCI